MARIAETGGLASRAQIEILLREALGKRGVKVPPPEQRKRGRPPKETKNG